MTDRSDKEHPLIRNAMKPAESWPAHISQPKSILKAAEKAGGGWKNEWNRVKKMVTEEGIQGTKIKKPGAKVSASFMLSARPQFAARIDSICDGIDRLSERFDSLVERRNRRG